MAEVNKGLGWRPDLPDVRDEKYSFRAALKHEIVPETQLPPKVIVPWHYSAKRKRTMDEMEVNDQGQTSSCTGQSSGTMIDQMSGWVKRSRLFLYWNGREAIGETRLDNGAYIRDVIKAAADKGAGSESLWPFREDRVKTKPSTSENYSAARHKISAYHRLQTRQDFLSCLAQGYAFVIGFTCYEDFVMQGGPADKYGILSYPRNASSDYGGHAVCVIGYDNDFRNSDWGKRGIAAGIEVPSTVYIVRNSWGSEWGNNGNFAVDSAYFENNNLADDAWTVRIGKNSS